MLIIQIITFPQVRFWPILYVVWKAFQINLQQKLLLLQLYLGQPYNDWTIQLTILSVLEYYYVHSVCIPNVLQ